MQYHIETLGPTICHSERSEESALAFSRDFHVYILASKSRILYVGMTNDLIRRVLEHKAGEIEGFTKRYRINRLVYFEHYKYVINCIAREKQIKSWSRAKKVALIEVLNPTWEDLAVDWGKPVRCIKPLKPKADSSQRSE